MAGRQAASCRLAPWQAGRVAGCRPPPRARQSSAPGGLPLISELFLALFLLACSATTYSVVQSLRQSVHSLHKTFVISLLQPAPEVGGWAGGDQGRLHAGTSRAGQWLFQMLPTPAACCLRQPRI